MSALTGLYYSCDPGDWVDGPGVAVMAAESVIKVDYAQQIPWAGQTRNPMALYL